MPNDERWNSSQTEKDGNYIVTDLYGGAPVCSIYNRKAITQYGRRGKRVGLVR